MTTRYFFLSFAAVVLAACSQLENPAGNNVPVSLTYSTVAATETKAAQNLNEGTFASGESIAVRISNTEEYDWSYYTFETGDDGAMSPVGSVPYYPAGSQNIDIIAYYPAGAGDDEENNFFTIATNQTGDGSYKASDLMFAVVTNQAKQADAVNLAFTHLMAKICVNITAGDGVTGINSVSILNVKPTVVFNWPLWDVFSLGEDAQGDATRIAVSNNGAAVIPAQRINGDLLEIVTDQGTATFRVFNMDFEAGHLYIINIAVDVRAVGTTTEMTAWTGEGIVTIDPYTETEIDPEPEDPYTLKAIDMGNGLKWANMNVGARSVSDYGDYFAWGETRPYYVDHDAYGNSLPTGHWIDGKTGYNWENYSLCDGTLETLNKYCDADNKSQLELVDDAAHANWGGNWRMPTKDEWEWLSNNCSRVWIYNYNNTGVQGYLITSNINGHAVFLPAAGYMRDDNHRTGWAYHSNDNGYGGPYGYYWTSTRCTSDGWAWRSWHCFFNRPPTEGQTPPLEEGYHDRRLGFSVRAVMD